MGASFDANVYTGDRKEIEKKYDQDHERSRSERGSSYSGAIGSLLGGIARWHDLKLASSEEAYRWLEDRHRKGDPAEAVSFYLAEEQSENQQAKLKALVETMGLVSREVQAVEREVLSELRTAGRGSYVTCERCGSKLARERLNGFDCPLCPHERRSIERGEAIPEGFALCERDDEGAEGEDEDGYRAVARPASSLLTKAQASKLARAREKLKKAEAEVREARKTKPSKTVAWVVGGTCSL